MRKLKDTVPMGPPLIIGLILSVLVISGCATPKANSPIVNIYKIVNNGNFTGDCLKDDRGRVSCPKIKHNGPITSTYTTSSDVKPTTSATQTTTASPSFELKAK